jgi:hypothetical protein
LAERGEAGAMVDRWGINDAEFASTNLFGWEGNTMVGCYGFRYARKQQLTWNLFEKGDTQISYFGVIFLH